MQAARNGDYVSDGIAEALLNALVRIPAIRVVPRSTSFRYRSSDIDLRTAAREMRVEAIVTGRVAARGDGLTVRTELVNARTDSQIWGGRFHGRTSELLHLQRQIESEIAARIVEHAARLSGREPQSAGGNLSAGARSSHTAPPPRSPAAAQRSP